jgi:aspartate 1-decarboxylase
MRRTFLKSKIHGATVTQADLRYQGSITIDQTLLKAADILPYEKVQVVNLNNGARLETYVIEGKQNSGVIGLNGGMARWGCVGDRVLIISYADFEGDEANFHKPKIVHVNSKNKIVKKK